MQDLPKRDEAIQCVMQAAARNERPRQVGAHFPVDADDPSGCRSAGKSLKRDPAQVGGPSGSIANEEGGLAERVHPLGDVMEILTVPIPLQTFVERFVDVALFEWFPD